MERHIGGDASLVGNTDDLEVIILIEVVSGNRFIETQLEVIPHSQDGVSGFGFAEHARVAGILDTGQDGGGPGDESRPMPAEGNRAQVVLLLYRIPLAVETEILYLSILDHRLSTGSELIETVLGVVRAEIDPCIIGLRRQFVLQLDMVKMVVIDIKSVNRYRHIISVIIMRREGIHDPFVRRHGDIHRAADGHIMDGETYFLVGHRRHTVGRQDEAYILIVVRISGMYLNGFGDRCVVLETELTPVRERHSVDGDLGAVGVGIIIHPEGHGETWRTGGTYALIRFVPHGEGEFSRLIMRHIADIMTVDDELGVLDLPGSRIEWSAGVIEIGGVRWFPRALGSTAYRRIHQGTEEILVFIITIQVMCLITGVLRLGIEIICQGFIDTKCQVLKRIEREDISGRLAGSNALSVLRQEVKSSLQNELRVYVEFDTTYFCPHVLRRRLAFFCCVKMLYQQAKSFGAGEQVLQSRDSQAS